MSNSIDIGSLVERRKDDAQSAMSCMHVVCMLYAYFKLIAQPASKPPAPRA
jgi:hypothetical protein